MRLFLKTLIVIVLTLVSPKFSVCNSRNGNLNNMDYRPGNYHIINFSKENLKVPISHIEGQLWAFEPLPKEVRTNFYNKKQAESVLVDPDYWIWGRTVMRWNDGKYHAYYSRWMVDSGFTSWLTDCEIAHAVADKPEGPYTTENVVLESRNKPGWESATAHNPNVCVADGKICLYYISTDLNGIYTESEENYPVSKWIHNNWYIARNRQRIGVAISTNPEGPFVRSLKPIVEPQENLFNNIAVNPAVTFVNGTFTMIIKGDDVKHKEIFRIQLAGHSNQANGPFEFDEKPVFDQVQTEDATIWYDQKDSLFYMVCHVIGAPELLLLRSANGKNWGQTANPIFMEKEILLDNGEVWKPERMERPFVLTDEQGQAIILFVAVKDKGVSGNIAIPMRRNSIINLK